MKSDIKDGKKELNDEATKPLSQTNPNLTEESIDKSVKSSSAVEHKSDKD